MIVEMIKDTKVEYIEICANRVSVSKYESRDTWISRLIKALSFEDGVEDYEEKQLLTIERDLYGITNYDCIKIEKWIEESYNDTSL